MNGWQYTSAFVIQFRPETELEAERCAGRVEHVASSRAAHFSSLAELLAFLSRVLTEVHDSGQELRNPEQTEMCSI